MVKIADDAEYIKQLCLPRGPETFQTASADKSPEDVKEEKSDAECKYLYNSIEESAAGIMVSFKLKCHHPYMDRLPQMEEIVRTYESMTRLLLHLYELKHNPDTEGEFKARFESCKQVSEELKEAWEKLLFHRLDNYYGMRVHTSVFDPKLDLTCSLCGKEKCEHLQTLLADEKEGGVIDALFTKEQKDEV